MTEWSLNVGSPIPAPEGGGSTGLATSGGLIVVPAGSELVAYR
jgi:hypothetical protein